MTTYIIGHNKPDTDSVVSAMALESLYKSVDCFGYPTAEAVITDPVNPETAFLLEKFGVKAPRVIAAADIQVEDQIILVDHNEKSQRLEGLNADQIVDIIDHHKINLNLSKPINITVKAWGCSSTIIYFIMKSVNFAPDKKLAGLMLAAILSDTVAFKSPTCTPKDKELAIELAKLAEIENLDDFALEIFKAKSDLSKLSCEEIVKNDYKIFDFNGKKVMIDQVETVEQTKIIAEKKDCLLEAMVKVKKELELDLLFVIITDILKVNSKVLLLGPEEENLAKAAFAAEAQNQVLDIGPKLSRKKEIAPALEQALS